MESKNRQSKDFKEIWNIQTNMNVSDEQWDQIFHNWDDPTNCKNNKKNTGCSICKIIEKGGKVKRTSTGEYYNINGKIK